MATAKKQGLRERLLSRERPTLRIPIAVEDVTTPSREVALAEDAWRTSFLGVGDRQEERSARARKVLDAAVARLDSCYEHVTVRALEPEEFEALVDEHPAREDVDEAWNDETFPWALFYACADDDLSAQEWEEFLKKRCSQAERDVLLLAAQQVNVRAPSLAVPKD
jgi:hypothetical protein